MLLFYITAFSLALITLYTVTLIYFLPTKKNKLKNKKKHKKFHIITTILIILNLLNMIFFFTPMYGGVDFVFQMVAYASPNVFTRVILVLLRMGLFYGSIIFFSISVFGKIYFLFKKENDEKEE